MRKLFQRILVVFMMLAASNRSFAQAEINTEFSTRMNYVFGQLDKSRIPTGLLLDYAMEFASLANYNGVLTDTNKVNKGLLTDIYNTLLTSGIHSGGGSFYHPDYLDSLWQVQRQPGVITLCGLYYNYSRFKDIALSSNLVTVTNDQIYDRFVNGVWQNPYQTQTAFAISPALHNYAGKIFNVVLPSSLWLTNGGSSVSNLAVNFNDGAGYRTVVQGQQLSVNYADTGNKTWTFRLTLTNGSQLYCHTEMLVRQEPNNYLAGGAARFLRPGGPILLTADAAWNGQTAQGYITVDYANPADALGRFRLNRPLIVAEGFDPGHLLTPEQQFGMTDFISFRNSILNSNSVQLTNLLQSNNQAYDIIYVDWVKGTDFLQRNAMLLERVIRWVNEQKALDGSVQPNTILGQSMGGIIARWALRDMENKGLPHQTNLFINWDGPQLGANIPMAYQHLGRHASSFYLSTNLGIAITGYNSIIRPVVNFNISAINRIRSLFNGTPWNEIGTLPSNSTILAGLNLSDVPAARQLMMNRINLSGNLENNLFNALQTELNTLGYPQQSRNIAVSNGSECAVNQGFAPYADLLSFNGRANTRFLGDVLGTIGVPFIGVLLNKPQFILGILPGRNDFFFDFNCKAQPSGGTAQIYRGKITYRKKVLYFINSNTTITDRTRNAFAGILPVDGTGGGMYDTELNFNSADFQNWLFKYSITANNIPHFNFVPTPSALGIGNGATQLSITDYSARYTGALPPLPPLNSPFANFTTAFNQTVISNGNINNNENHIQISPRNGNFVAAELDRLRLNPNSTPPQTNCNAFCVNGAISGNTTICTSQTLTAPFGNGVTYNWVVGNTSLVTPTPNGNTILLTRNGSANGQTTITVNISGACGNTTLSIPIVVGKGANAITFNQCIINCDAGPYLYANITPVSGALNCNWYYKDMSSLSNPFVFLEDAPFGTDWRLRRGNRNYTIRAEVVTSCGNLIGDYVVFAPSCTGMRIAASPNPASGNINLTISEASDTTRASKSPGQTFSSVSSFNSNGKTIISLFEFNTSTLVNQWIKNEMDGKIYNLNLAGIKQGLYILQVDRDNQTNTTKIIVE